MRFWNNNLWKKQKTKKKVNFFTYSPFLFENFEKDFGFQLHTFLMPVSHEKKHLLHVFSTQKNTMPIDMTCLNLYNWNHWLLFRFWSERSKKSSSKSDWQELGRRVTGNIPGNEINSRIVNSEVYCKSLFKLRRAIQNKRREETVKVNYSLG